MKVITFDDILDIKNGYVKPSIRKFYTEIAGTGSNAMFTIYGDVKIKNKVKIKKHQIFDALINGYHYRMVFKKRNSYDDNESDYIFEVLRNINIPVKIIKRQERTYVNCNDVPVLYMVDFLLSLPDPKATKEVIVDALKLGYQKHGGDHASGEIENSPNKMENGMEDKNGNGNGNSFEDLKRAIDKKIQDAKTRIEYEYYKNVQKQHKNNYERVMMNIAKQLNTKSTAIDGNVKHIHVDGNTDKFIEYLNSKCGRSQITTVEERKFNVKLFNKLVKTNRNITPAINNYQETDNTIKMLLSPDVSGSCAGFDDITVSVCDSLAHNKDIDAVYIENVNGVFFGGGTDWSSSPEYEIEFIKKFDYYLYFGDADCIPSIERIVNNCTNKTIFIFDIYQKNNKYCYLNADLTNKFNHKNGNTVVWLSAVDPYDLNETIKYL